MIFPNELYFEYVNELWDLGIYKGQLMNMTQTELLLLKSLVDVKRELKDLKSVMGLTNIKGD